MKSKRAQMMSSAALVLFFAGLVLGWYWRDGREPQPEPQGQHMIASVGYFDCPVCGIAMAPGDTLTIYSNEGRPTSPTDRRRGRSVR